MRNKDHEQQELQSLGIDPSAWSWMHGDYSQYQTGVEHLQPQSRYVKDSLFSRKKLAYNPGQAIYGRHDTEWGRGASDSTRSNIWVMGLLLNRLARIPGVTVFHGLKVPGSGHLYDAEHAVMIRNNVYLIDSTLRGFSSGNHWHQNKRGKWIESKGSDGWRHTNLAEISVYYRKHLGPSCNVYPVLTVMGKETHITGDPWSPMGVGLFKADDLLELLGNAAVAALSQGHDRNPEWIEAILTTVRP